jgi:pyruvate/2-oxoglutarate dehydrogenase complex dihydrolipoamide acyltransferase (E2) component
MTTTTSATGSRDDVRPLSAHERLCGDIIDVLKTPLVAGICEIDFAAVHALRRSLPAESAPSITDVTMVVAAVARALAADPRLHTIHRRGRRIVPADVDVGVSVAGRGLLSPVTVVRGAQARTAGEIAIAIHGGSREALRSEQRDIERAWMTRLVPGPLRRLLLRSAFASPGFRRKLVGTFQVSSVGTFGVEIALTPVAAAPLLMLGRTQERAVVRDGSVVVRPRAWISVQADHRVLDAASMGSFLTLLQASLDRPQDLLERPSDQPALSVRASSSRAAASRSR